MTLGYDVAFVFALIAIAGILMASNRVRFDFISLLVVIALILSGILTVREALSGFGSSVVIMVASLLVVGEMLERTGVARNVGDWILRQGGSNESRLLVLIMVGAAGLGSAMSSTAVVAIFIPIILRISRETGFPGSRMLMPMAYAALISGMLTLIATPPNLVVSGELAAHGFKPLGFFSFTPIGLAILVAAIAYILLVGRYLLQSDTEGTESDRKHRPLADIWAEFRVDEQVDAVSVGKGSRLVGRTVSDAGLEASYGVRLLARIRRGKDRQEHLSTVAEGMQLQAGDIIVLTGDPKTHDALIVENDLSRVDNFDEKLARWLWDLGAASVIVHPESGLVGKTVAQAEFHARYDLEVVGLRSAGRPVANFRNARLAPGDRLLVVGGWQKIAHLADQTHDFVALEMPAEHRELAPARHKAPIALAIVGLMVLASILNIAPLVVIVLLAAIAAIVAGCLTADEAYRSIHWSSIVLVAGMLPLADALESTGGSRFIVDALLNTAGEADPRLVMSILFFLTAGLGLVLSNTASAVLVAPIALNAAEALGLSPYPFAVAVLIAASAAFSTPVSTPVVTLVVAPGRYRFMDFVKVGVPLLMITYAVTVALAPVIFPFGAPR